MLSRCAKAVLAQATPEHTDQHRDAKSIKPRICGALWWRLQNFLGVQNSSQRSKSASKRGPAPKIQQQLERVSALPKAKQRAIAQVLDSMLAQAGA